MIAKTSALSAERSPSRSISIPITGMSVTSKICWGIMGDWTLEKLDDSVTILAIETVSGEKNANLRLRMRHMPRRL